MAEEGDESVTSLLSGYANEEEVGLEEEDEDDEDEETESSDEEEAPCTVLPVAVSSALALNHAYQSALTEFLEYLQAKIRENRARQEDLKSDTANLTLPASLPGHGHPNSLLPFLAPYFKDVKGLSAPPNEDTLQKNQNGEVNQAYVIPNKQW